MLKPSRTRGRGLGGSNRTTNAAGSEVRHLWKIWSLFTSLRPRPLRKTMTHFLPINAAPALKFSTKAPEGVPSKEALGTPQQIGGLPCPGQKEAYSILIRSTALSAEVFERGLALVRLALACFACLGGLGVGMSSYYCVQLASATP